MAPYFTGLPHAIHDIIQHHVLEAGEDDDKEDILARVNHELELAGAVSHAWMAFTVGHAFLDGAEATYEHAEEMEDGSGELVDWEDDDTRDMIDEEFESAIQDLASDEDNEDLVKMFLEYFDDYEGDHLAEEWLGEDEGDDHVEDCDIEIPTEEVNAALEGLWEHLYEFHDVFMEEAHLMLDEANSHIYDAIQAAFADNDELTEEVFEALEAEYEEFLHGLEYQAYFAVEQGGIDYCNGATDVFDEFTSLDTALSYEWISEDQDVLNEEMSAAYDEDDTTGDETTGDETTGDETTGDETTGDETTGDETTGDDSTVEDSTVQDTTA